ncbi:MAG: DUF4178 domain-containing protein [Desulfobacterales bacterium]|nr:DUF4178 domain-containing protein [Desulfobacterales bacterium]
MSKIQRQMQKQFAHIRAIDPGTIIAPDNRYRYDVKTLGVGGTFRLDQRTYLVLEMGTYRETDDQFQKTLDWTGHEFKTVCLETGALHNLEWEEDDEVKVSVTTREIRFSELRYDDGEAVARDSDDLDEIAEKDWEIVHEGKTYDYEDDFAARYIRIGGKKPENVYFYEFEAEDGDQLSIEVWTPENGREEFQVFLSRRIVPDEIEVIVAGADPGE